MLVFASDWPEGGNADMLRPPPRQKRCHATSHTNPARRVAEQRYFTLGKISPVDSNVGLHEPWRTVRATDHAEARTVQVGVRAAPFDSIEEVKHIDAKSHFSFFTVKGEGLEEAHILIRIPTSAEIAEIAGCVAKRKARWNREGSRVKLPIHCGVKIAARRARHGHAGHTVGTQVGRQRGQGQICADP